MKDNTAISSAEKCLFCKEPANTKDHIPPKNLFPRPRPALITVPACFDCNNGHSQDDAFFRNVLLNDDRIRNLPQANALVKAYERSLRRPQATGLAVSMLRNRIRFPLISPQGIYQGEGTALQSDFKRERKVLTRIMKGLFYHEFRRAHPEKNSISVFSSNNMGHGKDVVNTVLEMISYIKEENKKTIGNNIFSYGWAVTEDHSDGTFWVLTFFKTVPFFIYSVPSQSQ